MGALAEREYACLLFYIFLHINMYNTLANLLLDCIMILDYITVFLI